MKLKIIHYADIQIEIRTSGTGSQRLFEYSDSLKRMESAIENASPHIVVIAGDIFEFQATNGEETKLFGRHLNTISKFTDRVVIIPGNHDIRQRGIALYDIDKQRNLSDSIHSVVANIQNPKITYYDETGFYNDPKFDITWAVWSQRTKWNMDGSDRPYSPWDGYGNPDGNIIELFHDPKQGCIGFNRKSYDHFEEYPITLDSFKSNTILSGDIHAPEIIWFGDENHKLFTYSSSLVMRNFGEGDYYNNTKRFVSGNTQHGYNIIEFDTELNRAKSCSFIKLNPTVNRYTIRIDDSFNFEIDISRLELEDPAPQNKVRIECQTSIKKFTEHQSQLVEHLQEKYNIESIEFTYGADVIEMDTDDGDENLDVTELMSKKNLEKLSKTYIDNIVDRTKTIDEEDKDEAKELINGMFIDELRKINFEQSRDVFRIHRLVASNFMNFGTDVVVEFDKLGRITRISGTNGLGKTTIFRAIKWVLTDKMDSSQNDRNKKENYFAIFNDHSGLDSVFVGLDFSVNDDMHSLTKTLTRDWKKGKSSNGGQLCDLRHTPKLIYQLKSDNYNTNNTEEVETYLQSIISFDELDRFVFVDMDTLTDLIKMPSEDLGGMILDEIGLNFVNDLLDNYDEVRDAKLDKLTKPKDDVDVLNKRLSTLKGNIELLVDGISEKKSAYNDLDAAVKKTEVEIEETRNTLHKVEDVETIKNTIDNLGDELDDLIRVKTTNQEQLEDKQSKVGSLDKLNDEKIRLSGVIQTKEGEVINNNNSKTNLEQNIESKKEDAKKLLAREKENQSNKIIGEEGKISKLEQMISKADSELSEQKQQWKDNKQSEINTLQKTNDDLGVVLSECNNKKDVFNGTLNKLQSKEISLVKDIKNNQDKLDEFKNAKTCPTCKQDLDKTHIEHINKDIDELHAVIEKDGKLLDFAKKKIVMIGCEIESITEEITTTNDEIKRNKTAIGKIQNDIDLGEYPTQIIDLVKLNETKKLETLKEIEIIGGTIKSINNDIIEHVKESVDYKEIIQQIQEYRSKINDFIKENEKIGLVIIENQVSLTEVNSNIRDVKETNEIITQLKEKLNDQKNSIIILESKIKEKKSDLILAESNVPILAKINDLKGYKNSLWWTMENLTKELNELTKREHTNTVLKDQAQSDIEDARKYKVFSSSMKLYKKLLGKKGLPVYIFSHIIPMLNKKMNELLDSVKFRLMFDSDTHTLKFHDIEKGVSRSVKFTSGMENTIIGLTLVHVIRKINNSKTFDVIFIDEISGKLNSGKDLNYDAPNYQKIVSDFLIELSKDMKVFIVDHVLELENFDVISVYPDDGGAANVKIYKNMNTMGLVETHQKVDNKSKSA